MYLNKSIYRGILLWIMLAPLYAGAQYYSDSTDFDWRRGSFPKEKEDEIYQIKVDGFYRFFATHLMMDNPYILDPNSGAVLDNRTLFIGDDSQLPNFLININGRPNKKVSWGLDLFMFQFLNGNINPTYTGQVPDNTRPTVWDPLAGTRLAQNMGLNLGMNLYGSYLTEHGTFNVRLGGIHWFSMSDLTLSAFQGYNRFTLTERNPWDPIGSQIGARYEQMYANGAIYQDQRWGERAVQGIILEGIGLPDDWSFALMYGKTELNGGFLTIPNSTYGGQLKKVYRNSDYISFQTINNLTWSDSINEMQQGFNMHTVEWRADFDGFLVQAEVGAGKYKNGGSRFPWGEAINAKFTATRQRFRVPFEVHYYRISPYVVNNNAIFWNTSLDEFQNINQAPSGNTQGTNVLVPFASSVVQLGQMTNNRTGVNLNTSLEIGDLNLSLGYGVSTEIDAFQNRLTFSHFVNQLTRSRFWRWEFPSNIGPYGNYDKLYRDAIQKVDITEDSLGVVTNPKKFNQIEVHGKYKTKIGYRNLYIFFLGRYYTAQPEFSLLPKFNEEAYLRQYSSEMEIFYELNDKLILNSYLGYERNLANYQTVLNSETFRPLNQTGWGLGLGFDVALGKNAGLFFRHRWFNFEDTSFPLDAFSGQESSLEIKVFF